jgi:hypothetical protein
VRKDEVNLRNRLFVTISIFILPLISVPVLSQDVYIPQFELVEDCFVSLPAEIDFDCGYVTVPESYTGDGQRDIRLGVVRFNAVSENPGSPLFMLMGGPGQSIAEFLSSLPVIITAERARPDEPGAFSRILEDHDIVFVAQRGTEFTDPFLTCPELGSLTFTAYEQQLDADEQLAQLPRRYKSASTASPLQGLISMPTTTKRTPLTSIRYERRWVTNGSSTMGSLMAHSSGSL